MRSTTATATPHELIAAAAAAKADERPGNFDWEVLADADAEYHAWLDAHHADAIAAIDAEMSPANDNHESAA